MRSGAINRRLSKENQSVLLPWISKFRSRSSAVDQIDAHAQDCGEHLGDHAMAYLIDFHRDVAEKAEEKIQAVLQS